MSSVEITEYYDHQTLTNKLDRLADAAPGLVRKRSIGTSPDDREIWAVTVANEDTDPPVDDRPALLLTANHHAPEVSGSWVALHFIRHLIEQYGSDETVTRLLDEQTFHVIPRVSPDGAEVALTKRGKIVRSRYIEADPDAIYEPNVVVPRDLTGDGRILQMRWPDDDGDMVPFAADDPAMVSAEAVDAEQDRQRYRVVTEGDVANHDGGRVRDPHYGYRRSDFNRNYPAEGWQPFDWEGHGKYPLSEPETRAVADFLYDRPNVTAVLDLHTGNPAIFYPAALAGSEPAHESDAKTLREIGDTGEALTGFPYIWGYGELRGEQPRTELSGSFKDFAYERLGVPSLLIELGMLYNYLGMDAEDLAMDNTEHEQQRTARLLEYQADHPERPVFHDWVPYDHPELGPVEIGGLNRTTHGNPPAAEMPDVAGSVTEFALSFAGYYPALEIRNVEATPVDDEVYHVAASVRNTGQLPTNLTEQGQATNTRIPDRPRVELATERDVELVTGRRRQKLDHLSADGDRADLEWVIHAQEPTTVELTVTIARGASAETTVRLE